METPENSENLPPGVHFLSSGGLQHKRSMLEQRSTAAQQHHVSVQHGSLRHCSSVAARKSIFAEHAAQHQTKMAANPFSGGYSGARPKPLSKTDPGYGKPVAGSKSERRGLQAAARINAEVAVLCDMIHQEGEQYEDGTATIRFGDLFQIYTRISNKVVGILLRARKHSFVAFEGEVLFQGRDDNEPVSLLMPIKEIRSELNRDKDFVVGVCHRGKEGQKGASEGTKGAAEGTKGASEGTKGVSEGTKGASEGTEGASDGTKGASEGGIKGASEGTAVAEGDTLREADKTVVALEKTALADGVADTG